jgi:hypothetical protein
MLQKLTAEHFFTQKVYNFKITNKDINL